MTNEEVIENLKYLISDDCTDTQHDFVEEIKIAIDALCFLHSLWAED